MPVGAGFASPRLPESKDARCGAMATCFKPALGVLTDGEELAMYRHPAAAFAIVILGSLFLSACISRQEMLARHRSACVTYGFSPGTEQYSNCLLQLDVGDYGYGHHGRRPVPFQGRTDLPAYPPAPDQP